ncbi:hypothetical protein EYC84_009537 [Monilinia fructicola]|nr:hypothetical protein EYC84_009537 [Monilinia fructicola]
MSNAWGSTDAWGSNDAWGSSAKTSPSLPKAAPPVQNTAGDFGGWGGLSSQSIVPGSGGSFNTMASPPKVAVDDDFGGWSSAAPAPAANATSGSGKSAGGFSSGGEDLFSNRRQECEFGEDIWNMEVERLYGHGWIDGK